MIRILVAALAVACLAMPAASWHSPAPAPTTSGLTLDPGKWQILYSKNMPRNPSAAPGGFQVTLPRSPGEIDYLMTSVRMSASVKVRVTLSVEVVSGAPVFQGHNDNGGYCTGKTVTVRPMLQKRGDRLTAQNGRFWSRVAYVLAPGAVTLDIPLTDLTKWSNVQGKSATERQSGFAALLRDLGSVGLTFGGCGNYGHGVNTINGTANVIVTEYTVQ